MVNPRMHSLIVNLGSYWDDQHAENSRSCIRGWLARSILAGIIFMIGYGALVSFVVLCLCAVTGLSPPSPPRQYLSQQLRRSLSQSSTGSQSQRMKGLFKSKPHTPVDVVRQTRDLLIYAQRTSPDSKESKRKEKEFFRENTLRLLITCLPKLNLEARKDAIQVVANLQRQQVHSKLIASDYLEENIDLMDVLIQG